MATAQALNLSSATSTMSADTLCWTDIPVTNLDRAIKFYSDVLRQDVRKMSEGGLEYGLLPHEEQNASGCLCTGGDSAGDRNEQP